MYTDGSPELFIEAYRQGIFPMADSRDSLFYNFYRPEMRGLLPIAGLHIPKKLKKTLRQSPYDVTINTAFENVIEECAKEGGKGRQTTWINKTIRSVFLKLHQKGRAHSVECWQGGKLVGGLYGLAIGKVFCGESMFSRADDASKVALVHLAARLWMGGFAVLDTQFVNEHLKQFGAYEMPQEEYEALIEREMPRRADFLLKGKTGVDGTALHELQIIATYLDFRNGSPSSTQASESSGISDSSD